MRYGIRRAGYAYDNVPQHQLRPSDEILCSDGWYYPATRLFAFYPVRRPASQRYPTRTSVTVRPGSFTVSHE